MEEKENIINKQDNIIKNNNHENKNQEEENNVYQTLSLEMETLVNKEHIKNITITQQEMYNF